MIQSLIILQVSIEEISNYKQELTFLKGEFIFYFPIYVLKVSKAISTKTGVKQILAIWMHRRINVTFLLTTVRRYAEQDMILILMLFLNSKHKLLIKYRKDLYGHNSLANILTQEFVTTGERSVNC